MNTWKYEIKFNLFKRQLGESVLVEFFDIDLILEQWSEDELCQRQNVRVGIVPEIFHLYLFKYASKFKRKKIEYLKNCNETCYKH